MTPQGCNMMVARDAWATRARATPTSCTATTLAAFSFRRRENLPSESVMAWGAPLLPRGWPSRAVKGKSKPL